MNDQDVERMESLMEQPEPDQIDMMSPKELENELRTILKKIHNSPVFYVARDESGALDMFADRGAGIYLGGLPEHLFLNIACEDEPLRIALLEIEK